MINKDVFHKFYSDRISDDKEEADVEYKTFSDYYDAFLDDYNYKEVKPDTQSDYVRIAYFYAMIWGYFSFCTKHDSERSYNSAFSSIFIVISNDILAIIKLSLDGLDYQAKNIIRNLYELCLLLLNICIDDKKRDKYCTSARENNSYEVWRECFNVRSMLETLDGYREGLTEFWNDRYKLFYNELSSFAHNDILNIYIYSYQKPQNGSEDYKPNVFAHYVSRCDDILSETIYILWIATKLFRYMVEKNKTVAQVFENCQIDLLKCALNGCGFVDYYCKYVWAKSNTSTNPPQSEILL